MSTAGASGEKWATRTRAGSAWAPAATGRASRLAAHSARTRPARRSSERGDMRTPFGTAWCDLHLTSCFVGEGGAVAGNRAEAAPRRRGHGAADDDRPRDPAGRRGRAGGRGRVRGPGAARPVVPAPAGAL